MTVSELAKRAMVTAETVRYYTRNGLLFPLRDENNGYHCYNNADLARLSFIRKARLLGFSIANIREIFKESSNKQSTCPQVRKIMGKKLQETRLKLQEMTKLQDRMEHAAKLWMHMPDGEPAGHCICHLIEKIAMED